MNQQAESAGVVVPGGSESERLRWLTLAIEQSPAAALIADKDGLIQYVNRRFTEMTGYRPEDAIGQTPRILKSGLTPPSAYQELWNAIRKGTVWKGELCNRRKDGELYWHSTSISPLLDDAGELGG